MEAVIPFKNLVVRIATQPELGGFEALVKRQDDGSVGDLPADLLKDIVEATGLLFGGAKNEISHPGFVVLPEFIQQQVKLLVEGRLWPGWPGVLLSSAATVYGMQDGSTATWPRDDVRENGTRPGSRAKLKNPEKPLARID